MTMLYGVQMVSVARRLCLSCRGANHPTRAHTRRARRRACDPLRDQQWLVRVSRTARREKSHKSAARSDGRKWGQTRDADEIRHDFRRWPDANVGVVCGAVSGIFVIEAETTEGHDVDGIASLAALEREHDPLPATRQAESPSGSIHHYFKHPGFKIKNSASEIAPGVDVRGDGGM